MPKPDWLIEQEQKKKDTRPPIKTCGECGNLGKPIKTIRYKAKEWTDLFECAIHPGCYNTKYSLICEDNDIIQP